VVKTYVVHHLPDMNDLPAAERWFYRRHVPEVLRNRQLSYVSFRAVPPPPGADFVSTFLLERPSDDRVRDVRPFYV
jgi:hypothetical protein